ncbi:hypothetical protein H0H81_005085 [Sphagnurus paluster]|uniref:ELMO domain-containing protein n=1 Tax=Sphagnurus paluster TaxID=117069 RepID=A0A9P7K5W4_9AGAR|nr:hypothetical protein H0H81_005085 [Sphagnurus paluster]
MSNNRLSPGGNGSQTRSGALVPTNTVTTIEGVTARARIDPTLTVDDVVKQLCINLKKESPSHFALRDENDELVTNDNLRKKIKGKVNLKLVNAPSREARETVKKLTLRDDKNFKLALFSLQKFIREEQFAQEFITYNGLNELVSVIHESNGNTLAYALTAMQNLMELDYGWETLDDNFILKVVQILSSPASLINVCRPATAILKKLVEADPTSAPGPLLASSSRNTPTVLPGSVYRYGFQVVFEQMRKEEKLLETVVNRLGSADTAMAQYSMMLINSLLSHASDNRWEEFMGELERLNVRKAVVRLMSLHIMEDLTSCILDFQANIIRVTYRKKTTLVDPDSDPSHAAALQYIWKCSDLEKEIDEQGYVYKWRKLGFNSEDMVEEFNSTSTTFQPFFLDFYKVHSLATHFFLRMWTESGAAFGDFTRVAALVRSQLKVALRSENVRPWHEVEHDFNHCEYRAVRDRQMEELELEDDLLSKVPVRNLRAKLYKESYEFVRQQRIQCLLQGAWFINALPQSSPREPVRRPTRPWRFMRLDNAMKYIHYVDSAIKFPVRSGLEDLPERIDVSMISEIATGTCCPPPNVQNDLATSPLIPSPLSFSLLSAHEGSLADQIASDQSRWADWTDGLNMLRRDSGHVSSKETAGFVHALTEIGLKIKLLDLSGEKVEIPSGLVAGPPPTNTDFFFSDLV